MTAADPTIDRLAMSRQAAHRVAGALTPDWNWALHGPSTELLLTALCGLPDPDLDAIRSFARLLEEAADVQIRVRMDRIRPEGGAS